MQDDFLTNQTEFMGTEPILEDKIQAAVDQKSTIETKVVSAGNKKKKKKLIFVFLISIVVFLFLAILLLIRRKDGEKEVLENTLPSSILEQAPVSSEFRKKFSNLEASFKEADPSVDELSFPPVDMEFALE